MGEMLTLQVTIFSVMAIGFLLKKIKLISARGQKEITDLVINLILPANIITSFMTEISTDTISDCVWIAVISIGIQLIALFYGNLFFHKENENRLKCLKYAIICSNAGFLGNPVAEGVFGPVGLMLASVYLIPQRIMMWSEGIAIFSGVSDKKATLKKVVTHPCVLACFIGFILMVGQIKLPAVILTPVQTLGRCNTALSMMVIGMILADIDVKTILDKTVIRYTIHRLVIIPIMVYLVCRLLPVSRLVCGVSVLLAAMPAGATTSMLAAKYNRDPEFATKLVVFSTLCSIPAIMIWSSVLM